MSDHFARRGRLSCTWRVGTMSLMCHHTMVYYDMFFSLLATSRTTPHGFNGGGCKDYTPPKEEVRTLQSLLTSLPNESIGGRDGGIAKPATQPLPSPELSCGACAAMSTP